mmetsp:Transcript_3581/g.8852  ORF Transcript_3581/g.8852 Transcript_3581/m.8852 type:complete len:358 (+) Transcript_3581:238-1311(+)
MHSFWPHMPHSSLPRHASMRATAPPPAPTKSADVNQPHPPHRPRISWRAAEEPSGARGRQTSPSVHQPQLTRLTHSLGLLATPQSAPVSANGVWPLASDASTKRRSSSWKSFESRIASRKWSLRRKVVPAGPMTRLATVTHIFGKSATGTARHCEPSRIATYSRVSLRLSLSVLKEISLSTTDLSCTCSTTWSAELAPSRFTPMRKEERNSHAEPQSAGPREKASMQLSFGSFRSAHTASDKANVRLVSLALREAAASLASCMPETTFCCRALNLLMSTSWSNATASRASCNLAGAATPPAAAAASMAALACAVAASPATATPSIPAAAAALACAAAASPATARPSMPAAAASLAFS